MPVLQSKHVLRHGRRAQEKRPHLVDFSFAGYREDRKDRAGPLVQSLLEELNLGFYLVSVHG
jgi:hypothetical protein